MKIEPLVKDLLHYAVVLGILAAIWTPVMNYFGGNVYATLGVAYVMFILADKSAHKILKVR